MVSVRRKKQPTSPSAPKPKHQEVNSFFSFFPLKSLEAVLKPDPMLQCEAQNQFLSSIVQQLKAEEQKGEGYVSSAGRQRGWAAFLSLRNPRAALAEAGLPVRGACCTPESLTETVRVTGHCHGPSQCPCSLLSVPAPSQAQPGPSIRCWTQLVQVEPMTGVPNPS